MSLLTTSPSFMSSLFFLLCILLLSFDTQHANFVANSALNEHFSEYRIDSSSEFPISHKETFKIHSKARKLKSANVIIRGNETIQSVNRTFQLGFFSTNGESNWYLGIWYAIPTQTRVWVANRENPIKNISQSSLEITETGQLAVKESPDSIVWQSTNTEKAKKFDLLESGNLVLYSSEGSKIWQSFDHPTDTWLPGMNITTQRSLTSWKSLFDPSPGHFSLRLNPQAFNEFQLVYNSTNVYWSTGNWTGTAFANVPQMTIRYIYKFHFSDPFLPTASFWYTERALDNGLDLPLTRFQVDVNGQLKQFTWSSQTENWNMFWSQPEDKCKVYGLCGFFGSCVSTSLKPCVCLNGFRPVDDEGWKSEDFTSGCRRESDDFCKNKDGFEEVGDVGFDGGTTVSFQGSRSSCEKSCLSNCSCIGLYHNGRSNLCKNVYGSLLNLRNLTSDGLNEDVFYIRVPKEGIVKENVSKTMVLVGSIVGSIAAFGFVGVILLLLKKRRENKKGKDDDGVFPGLNMKVFTYKELNSVTRGFSEKLGHGGFGVVFRGELSDSTPVAVKRLERPGSGEKEFRAEVCTIGNIQHVNLVRLRGFCSENSRRLLVYDYMPNGPLSAYLRRDGPNLCWDVRFRVAVGTARGIAYLHEECRDCIIHCDIKPENILLDGDYMAKVSDFGLAKLVGRDFSRVLATMRGTWGYVAPEWISGLAITPKADVYSYGMTLLELIGGRRNVEAPQSAGNANVYGEGGYGEKWFFPPWAARQIIEGNVAAIVDSRLGVAYNVEEAERLALVAIWCIQDDEETRPTMGMVVKMLEGVVEVAIPPPPKLIQALVAGESYRGVRMDSGMSTAAGCSDYNIGFSSAGSRSSLDAKECPVSKGEVTVKTLTPIYGRANITHEPEEDAGLKIPPRPTARRMDGRRQTIQRTALNLPVEEMIRHLGSRFDLAPDLTPPQEANGARETTEGTISILNRILTSRGELNAGVSHDDVDLTPSSTTGNEVMSSRIHSLYLQRQSQIRGAARFTSLTSALSSVESLFEAYFRSNPMGRNQEQPPPVADGDSFSSIAAVINSESQMDTAVEIDPVLSLSASSSRGRNDASRVSDVDSGDSRAHRRRRLN